MALDNPKKYIPHHNRVGQPFEVDLVMVDLVTSINGVFAQILLLANEKCLTLKIKKKANVFFFNFLNCLHDM